MDDRSNLLLKTTSMSPIPEYIVLNDSLEIHVTNKHPTVVAMVTTILTYASPLEINKVEALFREIESPEDGVRRPTLIVTLASAFKAKEVFEVLKADIMIPKT